MSYSGFADKGKKEHFDENMFYMGFREVVPGQGQPSGFSITMWKLVYSVGESITLGGFACLKLGRRGGSETPLARMP
jgi:hypothetical protein